MLLLCAVILFQLDFGSSLDQFKYEGDNRVTLQGCGIGSRYWGEKIIGGQETSIVEFPWTVSLRNSKYGGIHYCGGSLLNTRFVITAAHCVRDQKANEISVVLGSTRIKTLNRNARTVKVKRLLPHQKYDPTVLTDDIALIELERDVNEATMLEFANVRGICLPKSDEEFNGTSTVTGWGRTSEGGSGSDVLRSVDVDLMTDDVCRSYYGRNKIYSSMVCAGFKEGGKDACQGDSGGPLVKAIGNRFVLIGVVSWGHGCARPNLPGVYTQASRYVDWIEKTVRNPESTASAVKPTGWWWIGGRDNMTEDRLLETTTLSAD